MLTLAEARRIALSLPEATEEDHFGMPSFTVHLVKADKRQVADLLGEAWRRKAPKNLAKAFSSARP